MGKPSINNLKDTGIGRQCAILGSGATLPCYLHKIPSGTTLIAVNSRPLKLTPCEFIVSNDYRESQRIWQIKLQAVIKISPYEKFSTYRTEPHVWYGRYSSFMATYLACYMGFNPVILVGMDCYQGDRVYFNTDERPNHGLLQSHLEAWGDALIRCPNPKAIRAIGNPLIEIFGEWRPL